MHLESERQHHYGNHQYPTTSAEDTTSQAYGNGPERPQQGLILGLLPGLKWRADEHPDSNSQDYCTEGYL